MDPKTGFLFVFRVYYTTALFFSVQGCSLCLRSRFRKVRSTLDRIKLIPWDKNRGWKQKAQGEQKQRLKFYTLLLFLLLAVASKDGWEELRGPCFDGTLATERFSSFQQLTANTLHWDLEVCGFGRGEKLACPFDNRGSGKDTKWIRHLAVLQRWAALRAKLKRLWGCELMAWILKERVYMYVFFFSLKCA